MKSLWKISGWYMAGVGVIHTAVWAYLTQDALKAMLKEGLINTVGLQPDRLLAFWGGIVLGVIFIYLGLHFQEELNKYRKPLSKATAWGLVFISSFTALIAPVSGIWLCFPLCAIMLWPYYKNT